MDNKYYNSDEALQKLINGTKLTCDKFKKCHYIFMENGIVYDENNIKCVIDLAEFVKTKWKEYKPLTWLNALAAILSCQSVINIKTREKYKITENGLCIYNIRKAQWVIVTNLEDKIQQFVNDEWEVY